MRSTDITTSIDVVTIDLTLVRDEPHVVRVVDMLDAPLMLTAAAAAGAEPLLELSSTGQIIIIPAAVEHLVEGASYFYNIWTRDDANLRLLFRGRITLTSSIAPTGLSWSPAPLSVLMAEAGIDAAPNQMPYFDHIGAIALTPITPFTRSMLDGADAAAFWSTIGATSGAIQAYRHGNILGTVSQSSGVPTGAVIERGSNTNGEYVRFADGTQICNIAMLSNAAADTVWTFPAPFATTNCAPNGSPAAVAMFTVTGLTTVTLSFGMYNISGARIATMSRLTAIGRWY